MLHGCSPDLRTLALIASDRWTALADQVMMRGTNWEGADLSGSSLFGSFAKGANFRGANLTGADLESVDFDGADLTGAQLAGAQVPGDLWLLILPSTLVLTVLLAAQGICSE